MINKSLGYKQIITNDLISFNYIMTGDKIACSEQLRGGIAQFTVHSRDFVRKVHGRTILAIAYHASHTPLIFYQSISMHRLQINNKNVKLIFKYSFSPFYILKWTNWLLNMYVGRMKKAKKLV